MKKFIYSSLILGSAFALASCSADEPGAAKGDGNVSLTVQLPADVATRFGDASTINKLYYSICTVGTETTAAKVLDSGDQEWPLGQTSTTVDLQLVPGQEYQVVFFACNTAATGYTYTASNATLAVSYGADMINNDAYDAFSAVKGEISTNTAAEGKTITLTRPFAQLNIGTNDFDKGVVKEYLSNENNSYSSTLTIPGLSTGVNFLANTYTGSEEVTFNLSGIKEAIGGYPVENYSYLEMNYLLVNPASADASGANLVDATYAINADGLPVNSLDLTNLPLRANYQTNVYGSLLTQKASFTVEINQNFATGSPISYPIIDGVDVTPENIAKTISESTDTDVVLKLAPGTYTTTDITWKKGVNYTLNGNGEPTVMNVPNQPETTANVVLNNLSLVATDGNYTGGFLGLSVTYNNCNLTGATFLYANKVTLNNCTLTGNGDIYPLWTWKCGDVTLNGCTFIANVKAKGLLVYGDPTLEKNITVSNCAFIAGPNCADSDKGAIEMHTEKSDPWYGGSLIINNCTDISSHYGEGEGTLWREWYNIGTEHATDLFKVIVNGETVQAGTPVS